MSRIWIVVVLLLTAGTPSVATPQISISMSSVEVDLWPEYDRPNMLVIYKITLAPDVELPAALNLSIPAAAGRPNAVAEKQFDGRLTSVSYDQREQGDWSSVIFTASRPELQVEYYDPDLEKDGANRRFNYTWPADYAVAALTVQVQQPLGALEMSLDPAAEHTSPTGEGFIYHIIHFQERAAGDLAEVTIEYVKNNDTLSVASLPQMAPAAPGTLPITTVASQEGGVPTWIFLAVAAVAVVAAGGGLWLLRGRTGRSASAAGAESGGRGKPAARRGGKKPAAFCTQCGAPANPGDRFCHVCGSGISDP